MTFRHFFVENLQVSCYNEFRKRKGDIKMSAERQNEHQKQIDFNIVSALHSIGIPINMRGYHYLRDAITISIGNDAVIGCITKMIYPEIAKKHRASSPSVERAIRNAIWAAWERGAGPIFAQRYNYHGNNKPSNSEFIACIAEEIYLNIKYS